MESSNEIRRARIKLALLEQEGIDELLGDMIELAVTQEKDSSRWTLAGKVFLISSLKRQYAQILKHNMKQDGKQGILFEGDSSNAL